MKKLIFTILSAILFTTAHAAEATIEITGIHATPEFWIAQNKNGDNILFTPQQISQLNRQMKSKDFYSADLSRYPAIMPADKVNAAIREAEKKFLNNSHLISNDVQVRYAVTTQRGNIRLLPEPLSGYQYDELQGTAIDPAEAVAVLTESPDGNFVFVQSRNYIGWLDKYILAFTDRNKWLTYVNPQNFLVVIDNKKNISFDGRNFLFQMGAIIPLIDSISWTARLPIEIDGQLEEIHVDIPNDMTVNRGFLPCTTNNFIRQSLKFLGDEYGWGGLDDSVDCSAFVGDVYRSMGIEIPRDADRQEACMPIWAVFNNVNTNERLDIVNRAPVGSLLFKPGHVMLKLGVDENGNPLIIHAASSYFSGGRKIYIRKVIVSDLSYRNAAGIKTIDALTGIGFLH